jgi:hypothetical protein
MQKRSIKHPETSSKARLLFLSKKGNMARMIGMAKGKITSGPFTLSPVL